MTQQIKKETIICLDGKEREFRYYDNGSINYNSIRNGKRFGGTSSINKSKLPKFITKELLGI